MLSNFVPVIRHDFLSLLHVSHCLLNSSYSIRCSSIGSISTLRAKLHQYLGASENVEGVGREMYLHLTTGILQKRLLLETFELNIYEDFSRV